MNKQEHLLMVVSEEAGEITQEISKILRFGLDNYNPYEPNKTNEDTLLTEYYQLVAMMEHLQDIGTLKTLSEERIKEIKKSKIEKVYFYMEESKRQGTLKD